MDNTDRKPDTAIVTLTMNPSIDVMVYVDQLIAGPKLRTGNPSYDPGGGGINASRVIHELGGRSLALYAAGGAPGDRLQAMLRQAGIDNRHFPIAEDTRQSITITENSSGQLYRLVTAGPTFSEAEQTRCLEALEMLDPAPAYLVLSGSLPPGVEADFYRRAIQAVKPRGTRIILDTKADALRQSADEGVFLIKPNLNELSDLAGRKLEDEHSQQQAAEDLLRLEKAEVVAVSLGPTGVLLVTSRGARRLRAPSVPVRSAVGAGDSMVGGLTLALSRGMDVEDAVLFGIAAGSAAVMTGGTRLCRCEDVERLYRQLQSER